MDTHVKASPARDPDADALIELIRESVIGDDEATDGPFGPRRVTYADYTASGRSLSFIEDYLRAAVLPRYANTHTESSGTGLQTTRFREEARAIIATAVGAEHGPARGHLRGLGLHGRHPQARRRARPAPAGRARRALRPARTDPAGERPVVFIGPYEHHSNELPWRESIADVVTIHEDADGRIDLAQLERELVRHADRPLRIGSFSAASNVTGILSDTRAVSRCCSTATAPCRSGTSRRQRRTWPSRWRLIARPRMATRPRAHSGREGRGVHLGPQAHRRPGHAGVLVARRDLFQNRVPTVVGGGTVAYVNSDEPYVPDRSGASRGSGHAGHHRLHPGRSGVPAQGAGRRGGHRAARGLVHPASHRALGARAGHRHPG